MLTNLGKKIKNTIGKYYKKYSMKQIDLLIGNQYVSDNSTIANSLTTILPI